MYKEINPAVFAMVTFPFLYGVMYGDVGHGGLLFTVGILLTLFDSKVRNAGSIGATASSVRYLILLMGLFAFYNGFIYNEWFAIPINIFKSCYDEKPSILTANYDADGKFQSFKDYGYRRTDENCVYPLGYDDRWFQNPSLSLTNTNSYK